MPHFCKTNFPDESYLHTLVEAQKKRIESYQNPAELLVMWSGAALNWIGDAMTDPHTQWTKEERLIDELVLTGTNPEWNEIILKKAEKSPAKLRELIKSDQSFAEVFSKAEWSDVPILVREDKEGRLLIFDGMHRVIAGIRENKEKVTAWIARRDASVPYQPSCEPHVVYDLIRAYQISTKKDREGLISALRFLKNAYANVDQLLAERFGPEWIPNEEIQTIIQEAKK